MAVVNDEAQNAESELTACMQTCLPNKTFKSYQDSTLTQHPQSDESIFSAACGLLGRQPAPLQGGCCGVSAFAFQGTNAHAILQPTSHEGPPETVAAQKRQAVWQHRRWWFAPNPHSMLPNVRCYSSHAEFEICLEHASLSYLWDHQVALTGNTTHTCSIPIPDQPIATMQDLHKCR